MHSSLGALLHHTDAIEQLHSRFQGWWFKSALIRLVGLNHRMNRSRGSYTAVQEVLKLIIGQGMLLNAVV